MALRLFTALCFTALVQLLGLQITADLVQEVPITFTVIDDINLPQIYNAIARPFGSLLGAMTRLKQTNQDFSFTGSEDPDFGFFVESVNGVAGNSESFWEILSYRNGTMTPTPVGVGCYIPKANESIILRFQQEVNTNGGTQHQCNHYGFICFLCIIYLYGPSVYLQNVIVSPKMTD